MATNVECNNLNTNLPATTTISGTNGVSTEQQNGSANISALHRINSYLHNTLDLRNLAAISNHSGQQQHHPNNNSIDLVSGNTEANRQCGGVRTKSHSVNGIGSTGNSVDIQSLSHLINGNGTNGYTSYRGSRSSQSNGNNSKDVFSYKIPVPPEKKDDSSSSGSSGGVGGNSPPSVTVCNANSSLTSPSSHFSYCSPPKTNRISNVSDPGSPSLDDAIMMGIQSQRNSHHSQQHSSNSHMHNDVNSEGVTLADLMGSLNLSNTSSVSRNGYHQQMANNSSHHANVSGLNSTFNTSISNYNMPQGLDFSQLSQYQQNNSMSSWRGAHNRNFDHSISGSLSNNSYSTNSFHNGSSLLGNSGLSSNSSTLDMLTALERGAPLASFLTAQDPYSIEKAAKIHRTAAAVCEATCTWSGQLPVRVHKNPFYSCKVFLGGVPWDVTESALRQTFLHFANIQVEWPGKENSTNPPKGYVYILFDNEKQVKTLLASCSQDFSNGGNYYFKISSRRMRQKEVQVIPWVMSDSNYVRCPSYQLDAHKTVFIGALHGMLSAEALANIINDLFGGVVYAGIDTDKHKYPIGSGRITFNNLQSYRKAVRAAFVEIKTPKFTKKVQIDPYLADSLCQVCGMQQGPYFCRDETCFKYFCRTCWLVTPNHQGSTPQCHKPLMRNSKLRTQTRLAGLI